MGILLSALYLLLTAVVFLYSYGFVDFNLTLSSNPLVTSFVTWSQSLAMFNRPASTNLYVVLIVSLFLLYLITLRYFSKANSQTTRFPWKAVVLISFILSLSYPLLSSDVFKYLFSGRMVVDYGLNPHLIPPNHIEGDDWLRFMRWIHTPSPYGPVMTLLGVVYYLLGFGKFVPTLYLYKLDSLAWYLLAIYLVGKLARKLGRSAKDSVFAQLFVALNPLILLEWLVNAHNDAPMITLLLLSLYFLTLSKRFTSFVFLLLSAGIKYVTIIFLPVIILVKFVRANNHSSLLLSIYYLLLVFTLAPLLYKYSFQYQPWYVTWLVPFAAILPFSLVPQLVIAYSFGSLLRYLPFISTGLWGATPLQFALYSFAPPVLYLVIYFVYRHLRRL